MKLKILSAALFLVAFTTEADAQSENKNKLSDQQPVTYQSSAMIANIRLVKNKRISENDTLKGTAGPESLDINDIGKIIPEAISTTTVWKTRGKNDQFAINQPGINLQQLVPVLIGALKEQMLRIGELEKEVDLLKLKP